MQTGRDIQRKRQKQQKTALYFPYVLAPALLPVLHGETGPHLVRHSDAAAAATA